ncbi:hypothetical protein ACFQZ0_22415 [Streptomyces erythrogriseus]
MTGPDPAAPGDAAAPDGTAPDEHPAKESSADETEEHDQPQDAWAARRDLVDHSPRTMKVGTHAAFGGGYVAGDQHGVSGGRVTGDVVMGSKTVHHWTFPGLSTAASASGRSRPPPSPGSPPPSSPPTTPSATWSNGCAGSVCWCCPAPDSPAAARPP